MKYSIIALCALATAVLAKPAFLNSAFELEEGKPFELKYSGCEGGCTIVLQTGEPTHLSDVTTLTATAEGDSFTWTPSGLPSGTYSFKIVNNDSKEENYSARFEYSGTGTLTSSASTASATSSASAAASSSAASSSVASSSAVSSPVTSASTPAVSTTASRNATIITTLSTASSKPVEVTTTKKTEEPAKTTAAATTAATTVPDSGANRVASSLALVAGAIMAMVYLN